MARLDRLCLQEDDDDDDDDNGGGLWDEIGHEQREKLFEWVLQVNSNLPSRSSFTSTLRLIRDTGNVLCNRISFEGHDESQNDIQAVSDIAEDIRDALLDYQVCSDGPYTTGVQLKSEHSGRWHSSRQYTTRTAT